MQQMQAAVRRWLHQFKLVGPHPFKLVGLHQFKLVGLHPFHHPCPPRPWVVAPDGRAAGPTWAPTPTTPHPRSQLQGRRLTVCWT